MFKSQVHRPQQHDSLAASPSQRPLSKNLNPTDSQSVSNLYTPSLNTRNIQNSVSHQNLSNANHIHKTAQVLKLIKKIQNKQPQLSGSQSELQQIQRSSQVRQMSAEEQERSLKSQNTYLVHRTETKIVCNNIQVPNSKHSRQFSIDSANKFIKYNSCFKQNDLNKTTVSPLPLPQSKSPYMNAVNKQQLKFAKPPKDVKKVRERRPHTRFQQNERGATEGQKSPEIRQGLDYERSDIYTRQNSSNKILTVVVPRHQRSGTTLTPLFASNNKSQTDNQHSIKLLLKQIHSKKSNSKIKIPLMNKSALPNSHSLGASPVQHNRTLEQPLEFSTNIQKLPYMTAVIKSRPKQEMNDSQLSQTPVLLPSKSRHVILSKHQRKLTCDEFISIAKQKSMNSLNKSLLKLKQSTDSQLMLSTVTPKSPEQQHDLSELEKKLKTLEKFRQSQMSSVKSSLSQMTQIPSAKQMKMIQLFMNQVPTPPQQQITSDLVPLSEQMKLDLSNNTSCLEPITYRYDQADYRIAETSNRYIKISPAFTNQSQSAVSQSAQSGLTLDEASQLSRLIHVPNTSYQQPQLMVQSAQGSPIVCQKEPQLLKMQTAVKPTHELNVSTKQSTAAYTLKSINAFQEYSMAASNQNFIHMSSSSLTRFDSKKTNFVGFDTKNLQEFSIKPSMFQKFDQDLLDNVELSMSRSNNIIKANSEAAQQIKEVDSTEEKESSQHSSDQMQAVEAPINKSLLFNKEHIKALKHQRNKTTSVLPGVQCPPQSAQNLPTEKRYEIHELMKDSVILETLSNSDRTSIISSKFRPNDIMLQKKKDRQWLIDSLQFDNYLDQVKKRTEEKSSKLSSVALTLQASLCDTVLFDNSIAETPKVKPHFKKVTGPYPGELSALERSTQSFAHPHGTDKQTKRKETDVDQCMVIDIQQQEEEEQLCDASQKSYVTMRINSSSSVTQADFSALYSVQQSQEVNKVFEGRSAEVRSATSENQVKELYARLHVNQEESVVLQPKFKQPTLNRYILPSYYDCIYHTAPSDSTSHGPILETQFKFD